ncbi:MAG: hypothetical protein R3C05_15195 [Pirellulaceae bacterium]
MCRDAKPEMKEEAKPADTKPEDQPSADAKPEMKEDASKPVDELTPPDPPKTRVQTFEEVKDQVAAELAMPEARAALQKAMRQAEKEMKSYFGKRMLWQGDKDLGKNVGDRPEFDLKALGNALGLQYGVTGMQDPISIADQPIANSQTQGMGFGGGDSFANLVYNDQFPYTRPSGPTAIRLDRLTSFGKQISVNLSRRSLKRLKMR